MALRNIVTMARKLALPFSILGFPPTVEWSTASGETSVSSTLKSPLFHTESKNFSAIALFISGDSDMVVLLFVFQPPYEPGIGGMPNTIAQCVRHPLAEPRQGDRQAGEIPGHRAASARHTVC